jgi:hypothetical protein
VTSSESLHPHINLSLNHSRKAAARTDILILNAKSCSFDAHSTTMYLADRTSVECKPHVEVYTDGSTKLKEQTNSTCMGWGVILKTDCAPRPATYAMGRVRELGSTSSMLAR